MPDLPEHCVVHRCTRKRMRASVGSGSAPRKRSSKSTGACNRNRNRRPNRSRNSSQRRNSNLARPQHPDQAYYTALFKKVRNFRVGLVDWLNLWHQHFDWDGFGDWGWLHRRRHVTALLRALVNARNELSVGRGKTVAWQLFAIVHLPGSGDDAVYVHTENPHGTPFPCALKGEPLQRLPPLLAGRIDLSRFEVLVNRHDEVTSYLVVHKA